MLSRGPLNRRSAKRKLRGYETAKEGRLRERLWILNVLRRMFLTEGFTCGIPYPVAVRVAYKNFSRISSPRQRLGECGHYTVADFVDSPPQLFDHSKRGYLV